MAVQAMPQMHITKSGTPRLLMDAPSIMIDRRLSTKATNGRDFNTGWIWSGNRSLLKKTPPTIHIGSMIKFIKPPIASLVFTRDASNNPINKALFFYDPKTPNDTAFAVSILGAGGRAKLWRYSSNVNVYVE